MYYVLIFNRCTVYFVLIKQDQDQDYDQDQDFGTPKFGYPLLETVLSLYLVLE